VNGKTFESLTKQKIKSLFQLPMLPKLLQPPLPMSLCPVGCRDRIAVGLFGAIPILSVKRYFSCMRLDPDGIVIIHRIVTVGLVPHGEKRRTKRDWQLI
jgi:hypothetical protein